MKTCPSCNAVMDDSTVFCTSCGTKIEDAPVSQAPFTPNPAPAYQAPVNPNPAPAYQAPVNPNPAPGYQAPYNPAPAYQAPAGDPTDHTAEFTAEDVAENKPFALLIYIGGLIGLLIAIFLKKDSAYLKFHIRQGIKFYLTELLLTMIFTLVAFLVFPLAIYGILCVIIAIVKLICFFDTAKGLSKEPPIIKGLGFLKF